MRLISKREQAITKINGGGRFGIRVGKTTLESATENGGVFARITTKHPQDTKEYPNTGDKELSLEQRIVIDGECLRKMKIKKSKFPVLENVLLAEYDGKVCLTTTDLESTSRNYPKGAYFPSTELENCIPDTPPIVEIHMLKETVESALGVFPKGAHIRVRIHGSDQAIELLHDDGEFLFDVGVMSYNIG